jgi:hypothetical protein
VPSNGTVVNIFTHPEIDLDGELYVHVRYDMDLMINSNAYETFRNRAYFFFMFYLHDISIQSFKLVSHITVERKIIQIDEGGASKLKSGKLRNIMIVCPC